MGMTPEGLDALTEIFNIGVHKAASDLNDLLGCDFEMNVPKLEMASLDLIATMFAEWQTASTSSVTIGFNGSLEGTAALVFPPRHAVNLINIISQEDGAGEPDLDALRAGTLSEVGNIVLNATMGTLSNLLHLSLRFDLPEYREGDIQSIFHRSQFRFNPAVLIVRTLFHARTKEIEGDIMIVFELHSLDDLLRLATTMYDGV